MPRDINYKACPEGCEGVVIVKDLVSKTFNNVKQNGNLKILIECVWGNGGRKRVVSCSPITFNYYKRH
jgi:hypothetical protein